MQSEFYRRYIRSPEWEKRKAVRMEIDGYRCVMCGDTKALQVHHVSYRNLGHEDILRDLCTVCNSCHRKIHRYYDREKVEQHVPKRA